MKTIEQRCRIVHGVGMSLMMPCNQQQCQGRTRSFRCHIRRLVVIEDDPQNTSAPNNAVPRLSMHVPDRHTASNNLVEEACHPTYERPSEASQGGLGGSPQERRLIRYIYPGPRAFRKRKRSVGRSQSSVHCFSASTDEFLFLLFCMPWT